jgi:outer membrane receptor for ferrienterochelin and colicin
LNSLPINGRHWTSFALLSPGVTLGNSAFGLVTFRGATNLQNNFMVDGSDDNDSFDAVERGYTRVGYSTTQDSILEFEVLTSNVSAQYGRAVGGGVNAITRSGSNAFHGDLFEYWRDNEFGATNSFNILQTVPTTVYIRRWTSATSSEAASTVRSSRTSYSSSTPSISNYATFPSLPCLHRSFSPTLIRPITTALCWADRPQQMPLVAPKTAA